MHEESYNSAPESPDGEEYAGLDEASYRNSKQQPSFLPPPRFKQIDADTTQLEGLPYAFSPQRRGAKYLPGGLAAELQGWLSAVKGWEGDDASSGSAMSLAVDEVKPGGSMYLVKGHKIKNQDKKSGSGTEGPQVQVMLAGEGKLTGLGKRAEVVEGNTVAISQPVWEVALDGQGRWIVACDWTVPTSSINEAPS